LAFLVSIYEGIVNVFRHFHRLFSARGEEHKMGQNNRQKMKRQNKKNLLERSWSITFYLAVFLGFFGIDKIYLKKYTLFFVKFFTLGGAGIFWLIDIILLLTDYEYVGIYWIKPHNRLMHAGIIALLISTIILIIYLS
jgi:hypothetical protein